jgi:hypothetical protein
MDLPVSFIQLKPITTRFTNQDLAAVMTQDEIRDELGLPPLQNEEVVVDEDFSKVGMVDGQPVFDTVEEALAKAKELGCEGYHEYQYNGKTGYMACKNHEEVVNLSTNELEVYLDSLEDIPEDWELLEEEIVDGEHQDFDFETELNKIADDKLELASTGIARPNTKTRGKNNQDGVNKSFNDYYKVRYVYTEDNFLVNKSGTSRDFCKLMTSAKKIYRKQDIINMGTMAVNAGFGPRGASTYSIWFYKGGPECQHFWLRRIYKTSLRNAKSNISDSQLISYTKARSEGFTAEKNDNLVAKPPKRMTNHGYLNPR